MASKSTPSGGVAVFMLRSRIEVNVTFGAAIQVFSDPSTIAVRNTSAICKKRGPPCTANHGNRIGKFSSCMVSP
jgi:hypothetical protein